MNFIGTGLMKIATTSIFKGFPGGSAVENLPTMQELQEVQVQSLGQEDPLEEDLATHSSMLFLENPLD